MADAATPLIGCLGNANGCAGFLGTHSDVGGPSLKPQSLWLQTFRHFRPIHAIAPRLFLRTHLGAIGIHLACPAALRRAAGHGGNQQQEDGPRDDRCPGVGAP